MGLKKDIEIQKRRRHKQKLGLFYCSSDNLGVWQGQKWKLLPLAHSGYLSNQLSVPGSQPAIWAGEAMPTHPLAVKDVPSEYTSDDKCHFYLTVDIYGLGQKSLVWRMPKEQSFGTCVSQVVCQRESDGIW